MNQLKMMALIVSSQFTISGFNELVMVSNQARVSVSLDI